MPSVPGNSGPTVTGPIKLRHRVVTYDLVPNLVIVRIQVIRADGVTVDSDTPDPTIDGTFELGLPDTDGTYFIRIIRIVQGGGTSPSPWATTTLECVGPANGGTPVVTGNVDVTLPDNAAYYRVIVIQTDAAGNDTTSPTATVQLARVTQGTGGDGGDPDPDPTPVPPTSGGTSTTTTITMNSDPGGWATLLDSCCGKTKLALTDIRGSGKSVKFAGIAAFTIVDSQSVAVATG